MKKKTVKKPLSVFSIRLDEDKMLQVAKLKIDLPNLFRNALDSELSKRINRCPTCGGLCIKRLLK